MSSHPNTLLLRPAGRVRLGVRFILAIFGAAATAACTLLPTGSDGGNDNLRDHLVDSLHAKVDASGRLLLPLPPPGPYPRMTAEEAVALSQLFAGVAARFPSIGTSVERQHGARIDFMALKAAPRTFYTVTPYEAVPQAFHNAFRNIYGPYFLTTLLAGKRPVASVAVAAYGEARARGGEIVFPDRVPSLTGNEFQIEGIPRSFRYSIPVDPERAVRLVGEATGRRVAELPILLRPEVTYAVQYARWRIRIDGPVTLQVQGRGPVCTNEVYVGLDGRTEVRAAVQPTTVVVTDADGTRSVSLRLDGDLPVRFDAATPTAAPCSAS